MAALFRFLQSTLLTAWAQSEHCCLESHSVETQKMKTKKLVPSLRPRRKGAGPVSAFRCFRGICSRAGATGEMMPVHRFDKGQDPPLSITPDASDKQKQCGGAFCYQQALLPSSPPFFSICCELTSFLPGHSLAGDEPASSSSLSKTTASPARFTGPRFQALGLEAQPSPWTPAAAASPPLPPPRVWFLGFIGAFTKSF